MKKSKVKLLSSKGTFIDWISKADAKQRIKNKTVEVVCGSPWVVKLRESVERIGGTLVIRECRNHREELYYMLTAGRHGKPRSAMVDEEVYDNGYVPMPSRCLLSMSG